MGAAKEEMMAIEARGYGESEKYVCSGCVRDPYLQKVIRTKGQVGTCSFCKNEKGKPIRHRKTYPLESLMAKIMPAIDYYYMSTDGNIPYDGETEGYTTIPATLVGTAPAKFAENGRFNEKGDMMFYGASNPEIAVKEVGRKEDYPFTIGEFHTNKRIRVLDLSAVQSWKRPGTFSLAQEDIEKRESYLFLRQFIDRITHPVDDRNEAEEVYRPIQVFTKYLQRVGNLHGIVYRSSLADPMQRYSDYVSDRCYVLFAENRDCMDESDRQRKMNKKRLQLYMKHVYQTYDLQGQAGSKKDCGQERNEKRSIDGYLSDMDNV